MSPIAARLHPAIASGTLHLSSNFTQSRPLDGWKSNSPLSRSHDVLAITGNATLAGTLAVSLLDDFTPQAGNVFEIVSAAGFGGSKFANTSLPALLVA